MASHEAVETKRMITSLLTSNPLRSNVEQLCYDFRNIVGYPIPYQRLGFNDIESYLRSIPDTVKVYGSGPQAEVQGIIHAESAHINLMVAKQKKYVPPHKRHKIKVIPAGFRPGRRHPNSYKPKPQYNHNQLKAKPEPSCSKSHDEIESQRNNLSSIKDCSKSHDDIESQRNNLSSIIKERSNHRVPIKVQENLKTLILQFPDGIWCTSLPTEYRKLFKKPLNYGMFDYKSLIEMCIDLPEIFHYIQPTLDDYLLFDKNQPLPPVEPLKLIPTISENVVTTHIFDEVDIDWKVGTVLIPPDVLGISDEIPRFFPVDANIGDYLDIVVAEIYDISKFWINLDSKQLDALMKEFRDFFKENQKKYLIPFKLLEEGLFCVALYQKEYHRCVIVNMLPEKKGFIRVFFIDYGTVSNVSSNEIWFLPKQFSKMPCQAFRARLSNIYPSRDNTTWNSCSIALFQQLVTNRDLIGEVMSINKEDHVLELYIADVTDPKNIYYINDMMVDEGHAVYIGEEREKSLIDYDCIPNVQQIHLFPEFYEIEAGLAPTSDEMNYMIINKIPMHHYLPQFFDIYYNEDKEIQIKQYEENMKKKLRRININNIENDIFDFDAIPDEFKNDIKNLSSNYKNDIKNEDIEINGKCNRKRISEMINGCLKNDNDNTIFLDNNLKQLNLNNSSSISSKRKSTNPFLNNNDDDLQNNTNPFYGYSGDSSSSFSTVSDFNDTLYQFFNKNPESTTTIRNNLNDTKKQNNIDKTTNPFQGQQQQPQRIRTPPGFTSLNPINPDLYLTNPYYQRFPQFPDFVSNYNQLTMSLCQPITNYYNYNPGYNPNQINFNWHQFRQFNPNYFRQFNPNPNRFNK